jgi:hypothetical protein
MLLFFLSGIQQADFVLAGHFEKSNHAPLPSSVKTYGTATNSRRIAQ